MTDREIAQKALDALKGLVAASGWAQHPEETNEAIVAIAMLDELLDAEEKIKISKNNIVLNLKEQKLYMNGEEFYMESYSMNKTPNYEYTEIKLLINFDKPIGQRP